MRLLLAKLKQQTPPPQPTIDIPKIDIQLNGNTVKVLCNGVEVMNTRNKLQYIEAGLSLAQLSKELMESTTTKNANAKEHAPLINSLETLKSEMCKLQQILVDSTCAPITQEPKPKSQNQAVPTSPTSSNTEANTTIDPPTPHRRRNRR
jgi:hypothetical protein